MTEMDRRQLSWAIPISMDHRQLMWVIEGGYGSWNMYREHRYWIWTIENPHAPWLASMEHDQLIRIMDDQHGSQITLILNNEPDSRTIKQGLGQLSHISGFITQTSAKLMVHNGYESWIVHVAHLQFLVIMDQPRGSCVIDRHRKQRLWIVDR